MRRDGKGRGRESERGKEGEKRDGGKVGSEQEKAEKGK